MGAYGSDAVRYFFAKEVEFGRDGDFSEKRFRDIVNANLANSIGNLLNRALGLIKKFCGSAVPGDAGGIPEDHPLRSIVSAQVRQGTSHSSYTDWTDYSFNASPFTCVP